jgi:hypothetical protein
MRILMIAPEPFFEPRGTPFSKYHRICALTDLGHSVELVTYPFDDPVSMPGLRLFRCARPPFIRSVRVGPSMAKLPLDFLLMWTAMRRALATRYDAIHSHEEGAAISPTRGAATARRRPPPLPGEPGARARARGGRDAGRAQALTAAGIELVEGDLKDRAALERAVAGVRLVYHLAAIYRQAGIPASEYRAVNVEAVGALADAAREAAVVRLVHCSTVGVHGDVERPPVGEDAAFRPGDVYQRTKLAGEQIARVDFFTKSRAFDISRARREIGYTPRVGLRVGIRRTLAWYRERGWV